MGERAVEEGEGASPSPQLRIAVLCQSSPALLEFLGILTSAIQVDVRIGAVWAPSESEADAVTKFLKVPQGNTFWDTGTEGNDGLRDVYQCPQVDALAIVLPIESHRAVLWKLFHMPKPLGNGRRKSVLSVSPCASTSQHIQDLARLYYAQTEEPNEGPEFLWSVAEPLRYDDFVNRVVAVKADLGDIMGGTLVISPDWPGRTSDFQDPKANEGGVAIRLLCKKAVALLRTIFGSVAEVRSQLNGKDVATTTAVVGCIKFTSGVTINVLLCSESGKTMTLTVVGSNGNANVEYDERQGGFEVQRHLSHFEHPVVDVPNGLKWSIVSWALCARPGDLEGFTDLNSPSSCLIDYAVAEALLESKGAAQCFAPGQTVSTGATWDTRKICLRPRCVSDTERLLWNSKLRKGIFSTDAN